ncbi:DUF3150 domain-containing protein [Pseudomonas carnis]|nr:DUF3150 domain-containing protein [Pseudomonas carnis]
MTEKLVPLAFIHPLIKPLHDALSAELEKLPESGFMSAPEFTNFEQCLLALRDQRKVVDHLTKGLPLISVVSTAQQTLLGASAPQGNTASAPVQGDVAQQQNVATAPAVASTTTEVTSVAAPVEEAAAPAVAAQAADVKLEQAVPAVESSVSAQQTANPGSLAFYF